MSEKFFRYQMLTASVHEYIRDRVKKPLMEAIVGLAECGSWLGMFIALIQIARMIRRYPTPTRENCIQPNSQILFDIEDKFFEYEESTKRKALFRAAFKLLIAEYEHDPYYRYRFDWLLEEANKRGWLPRAMIPMPHWKELGKEKPPDWSAVVAVEDPDIPTVIRKLVGGG